MSNSLWTEEGIRCKVNYLVSNFLPGEERPDPLDLATKMRVAVRFSELGSCQGFYYVIQGLPFLVLNQDLDGPSLQAVAAHELGHHVLHADKVSDTMFTDYDLYLRENRLEYEANVFACHLLIPDASLDSILREAEPEVPLTLETLSVLLGVVPELLALKLRLSGYPVERPPGNFLLKRS